MQAINELRQRDDSTFTMQGADRIHPTNDGHMVMAYLFLKAQGLAGLKVAEVQIDSKNKTATKTNNCTVSEVLQDGATLTFKYLAKSLPYPVDTLPKGGGVQTRSQADGLKIVPFVQNFNQEILSITGLQADTHFKLYIDSTCVARYTGAEFANGINLALLNAAPQYQQALAVMHLNEERWALERKLREYYWLHYSILKPKGMFMNDSIPVADSLRNYARKDYFVGAVLGNYNQSRFKPVRATWQKEIDLIVDQIYTINKPEVHTISVVAVPKTQL